MFRAADLFAAAGLLDVLVTSNGDQAGLQAEVLALRCQVQVLERQIKRVHWSQEDRLSASPSTRDTKITATNAVDKRRLARPTLGSQLGHDRQLNSDDRVPNRGPVLMQTREWGRCQARRPIPVTVHGSPSRSDDGDHAAHTRSGARAAR